LLASIEHWKENLKAEEPYQAKIHGDSCALCSIFDDDTNPSCLGCPVMKRTNKPLCKGSPWEKVQDARNEWCSDQYGSKTPIEKLKDDFRAAAQEEVDFLTSLLSKEKTDEAS
jgi:hypothetical protein